MMSAMACTARRMFELLEPICLVTYFADECNEELAALGHRIYWDGYFASRAAPLGRVPAQVVHAAFYSFADGEAARHIPSAWETIPPKASVAARERGSAASVRRILGDELADSPGLVRAADLTTKAATSAPMEGRVMYAGMRTLAVACRDHAARAPLRRAHRRSGRRAHRRHGGPRALRAGAGHPPAGVVRAHSPPAQGAAGRRHGRPARARARRHRRPVHRRRPRDPATHRSPYRRARRPAVRRPLSRRARRAGRRARTHHRDAGGRGVAVTSSFVGSSDLLPSAVTQPVDLFQRRPLHPVVCQPTVRGDRPHGGAADLDRLPVGLGSGEAVIAAGYHPAGGNPAAVGVLERLGDLHVQPLDAVEERGYPLLELRPPDRVHSAARDDEVFGDEPLDRLRGVGVPHLLPEAVHDLDRVVAHDEFPSWSTSSRARHDCAVLAWLPKARTVEIAPQRIHTDRSD